MQRLSHQGSRCVGPLKHVASCSFGKDSLATILLALEHGEPLDEAVYCEVMFDKEISGEVPEHRDFIYTTAIPALERRGVKVTVLRSEKTYVDLFTGKITRGPKKGLLRSFPICGRCAVQRDCKLKPILRYQKSLPPDTVQYIGIAKDEQERLLRLAGNRVSLLDKYNCTEEDAKQLCQRAGLLSPVYTFTTRGGCWFCPTVHEHWFQPTIRHNVTSNFCRRFFSAIPSARQVRCWVRPAAENQPLRINFCLQRSDLVLFGNLCCLIYPSMKHTKPGQTGSIKRWMA